MNRLMNLVLAVSLILGLLSIALAGDLEDKLIEATKNGNAEEVKALLKKGANPNAKDKDGDAVLMSASAKIVPILVAAGADVNAKADDDVFGTQTALMAAAMTHNVNKVQALLDNGADVNAKNNFGETALTIAAFNGWIDAAKILVAKGADVNATPDSGNTALIQASDRGHAEVVRLLLGKRANVNAKNKDGMTALMAAEEMIQKGEFGPAGSNGKMVRDPLRSEQKKKYDDIVEALKRAGAK